jgi:diguanylate cyclase (GGDEF)-like protein
MTRWFDPPGVDQTGDQRALMGYVSGWMYVLVGVLGTLGTALPALRFHLAWQLGLGLASILYGALVLSGAMRWETRPMAVHITAMVAALPIIALGIWATGGYFSYIRPLLILAPIHWAFFLQRRGTVLALCTGLVLTFWSPLLYQSGLGTATTLARTSSVSITIFFIAGAVILIRRRLLAAETQLRGLAAIDPLTGLLNRRGFQASFFDLLSGSPAGTHPFVIMLDLDHFKALNDTYGHLVGDQALRCVAERLKASMRASDLAARIGGDEFVVAGHTSDVELVDRIAGRLSLAVSGELPGLSGAHLQATFGWASTEGPVSNAKATTESLLGIADQRMLARKRENRAVSAGVEPDLEQATQAVERADAGRASTPLSGSPNR